MKTLPCFSLLVALAVAATVGSSAAAQTVEVQRTPWEVLEVDIDLNLVTVAYETGGCWRGQPRASVTESASKIRIAIEQSRVVVADPLQCGEPEYGGFGSAT